MQRYELISKEQLHPTDVSQLHVTIYGSGHNAAGYSLPGDRQNVAPLLDGCDCDGRVRDKASDICYLYVEGQRVGIAAVAPHGVEDSVAVDNFAGILGQNSQNLGLAY